MKSLGIWLYFIAAITLSGRVNAEYVDNLPPIPYKLSPLIKGAKANLSSEKFSNEIESDPRKREIAIMKRGGREALELLDNYKRCKDKTIPLTVERNIHCNEIEFDTFLVGLTIMRREYYRAVFNLAGYSFDKSLIAFAHDCNTFGSCQIVHEKILELTNSMEFMSMTGSFVLLCMSNTPDIRKRFLPSNVAAACTQIMASAPFKNDAVCGGKDEQREFFCNKLPAEVKRKAKHCTETGNYRYPEIDCN